MTEFRFPSILLPSSKEAHPVAPQSGSPSSLESSRLLPGIPIAMVNTVALTSFHEYRLPKKVGPHTDEGKIYFNLFQPLNKGLVVMCHGKLTLVDQAIAWRTVFDELGHCLAANGFIAVSIKHQQSGSLPAADQIIRHVAHLLTSEWATQFALKGKPVALIGQSEGGHGAMRAARRITDLELDPLVTSVAAVIGLAPSPADNGIAANGSFAKSLLVLQGTHDGDGACFGAGSMHNYEDSSGSPSRHFCWIFGGSHTGFLTKGGSEGPISIQADDVPKRILAATQMLVTQNYVTMFLSWKMSNALKYRPLFIGDGHVSFSSANQSIQADLANRFESFFRYDSSLTVSTMSAGAVFLGFQQNGAPISPNNPLIFGPLTDRHLTLKGQSDKGYVVQWNKAKSPEPVALFVCDPLVMAKKPKFIELEAVLLALSPLNLFFPGPALVEVALVHKTGTSVSVKVQIPVSLWMVTAPMNFGNITRSIPSIIRIPVALFQLGDPQLILVQSIKVSFANAKQAGEVVFTRARAAFA